MGFGGGAGGGGAGAGAGSSFLSNPATLPLFSQLAGSVGGLAGGGPGFAQGFNQGTGVVFGAKELSDTNKRIEESRKEFEKLRKLLEGEDTGKNKGAAKKVTEGQQGTIPPNVVAAPSIPLFLQQDALANPALQGILGQQTFGASVAPPQRLGNQFLPGPLDFLNGQRF